MLVAEGYPDVKVYEFVCRLSLPDVLMLLLTHRGKHTRQDCWQQ